MSSLIPIGTFVLAKWPSTSNYYKARIIDYTDDNNYVCQFLDESIVALPSKYVDLPEKFQRTTKLTHTHNEQIFVDRSLTFNSMIISLGWIIIFLYIQHSFYHNPDLYGSSTGLSNRTLFQQYPMIVIQYLLLWFILQLIFARYFPHLGREQLIYIKESHPSIYYKHRSNSLLAFIITSLFSLGIALTFSLILLTNKLFSRYYSISINEINYNKKQIQFDFHLFLSIRPGIILWPVLNLLLFLTIIKYNRQISIRFALSILLQTIYIINVFINETSMIRQALDISPPSSFDAIFTNLCWVPFIATLTSIFPLTFSAFQTMNNTNLVDSVMVNNTQRILTSGCWRWCRHPHLLAEILMVIGWSLPAGTNHLAPWLYTFYIIGMAIYKAHYFDRALQNTCTDGAYEHYITHVKYTLIPFVY
ncbi:unnamed protein product [Rotaria sordida]|uniref:Uncharacterized protein n=1 Tax=Rotaria sordida TaxID=392033 RepID=A0A814BQN9_9BILA|nr:unnamed protein product [Rotaria sordida]